MFHFVNNIALKSSGHAQWLKKHNNTRIYRHMPQNIMVWWGNYHLPIFSGFCLFGWPSTWSRLPRSWLLLAGNEKIGAKWASQLWQWQCLSHTCHHDRAETETLPLRLQHSSSPLLSRSQGWYTRPYQSSPWPNSHSLCRIPLSVFSYLNRLRCELINLLKDKTFSVQ